MQIITGGGDGFCGWPTGQHLSRAGHGVVLLDNLIRRRWYDELGTSSLLPIAEERVRVTPARERV